MQILSQYLSAFSASIEAATTGKPDLNRSGFQATAAYLPPECGAGFHREASSNLSRIRLHRPLDHVTAAHGLLGRNLTPWQGRPMDTEDDEVAVRNGLSLLRFLGLPWTAIDHFVPGAKAYYGWRTSMFHNPYKIQMPHTNFGYPWHVKPSENFTTESTPFHVSMDLQNGQQILNPMIGSGEEMVNLLHRNPEIEIAGYDLNPDNLITAAQLASNFDYSPEQLSLALHDAHQPLPLPDKSVDRVLVMNYSTFGFDAFQRQEFYRHMLRVLRPGGRLWINLYKNEPPWIEEETAALEMLGRELQRTIHEIHRDHRCNTYAAIVA